MMIDMNIIHYVYMPIALLISVLIIGNNFTLKNIAMVLIGSLITTICWLSFFEYTLGQESFYFSGKNYIVAVEENSND